MGEGLITRRGGSGSQEMYRVGDIKTTVRTDLGDDWVLCNGDYFKEDDYPVYAKVCPDMLSLEYGSESIRINQYAPCGLASGGGYQVAFCRATRSGSGSTTYYGVCYSNDNFETYTCYHPVNANGGYIIEPSSLDSNNIIIRYIDGKWFLVYVIYNNNKYNINTYYTTDITNPRSWIKCCDNIPNIKQIFDVWEENNKTYIACLVNNNPSIFILNSITEITGSIVTNSVLNPQGCITSFVRGNGYYAFIDTESSSGGSLKGVFCGDDIYSSSWTYVPISFDNTTFTNNTALQYQDNIWYITGYVSLILDTDGVNKEYYCPAIAYTSNITNGNFTVTYKKDWSYTDKLNYLYWGVFARGKFFAIGNLYTDKSSYAIYLLEDITDPDTWRRITTPLSTSRYTNGMPCYKPMISDTCILFLNSSEYMYRFPMYAFPIINEFGCNTYIKIR